MILKTLWKIAAGAFVFLSGTAALYNASRELQREEASDEEKSTPDSVKQPEVFYEKALSWIQYDRDNKPIGGHQGDGLDAVVLATSKPLPEEAVEEILNIEDGAGKAYKIRSICELYGTRVLRMTFLEEKL